jgi:hypothetical protein
VRRLVALIVVALVGALVFGLSGLSSGLAVNGTSVSGNAFRAELNAIATTPSLQCYLTALNPTDFEKGGGSNTIAAAGAASWADLRIEAISLTQYARKYLHYHPDAATLAAAQASLESELTQSATAKSYHCPGTAAQALAAMPPEMRKAEVLAQASSLYLVSKLDQTLPLTAATERAYYESHVANYDTICVSIALVLPSRTAAFAQAQAKGDTVAELALKFSADPSAASGGAYGCYSPTSTSYASVRADVGATALNTFPTTPQAITYNNTSYDLYVAPTKRTVTPYATAKNVVVSDMQDANASTANSEEETILYHSAVAVDPAFGQWGLDTSGPTVFAPSLPAKDDVNRAKSLTASASAYN